MKDEILEVKKTNAILAYKNADATGKSMLADLLGKKNLYTDIKERIETFEDALEIDGECDSDTLLVINYSGKNPNMVSAQAYMKLVIIIRVLNEGWVPDWTNENQSKYFPWFKHKSGFGLACDDYAYWHTHTIVGSRLCFKTSELAEYAGKQFADIYNDFLTIK